MARANAPSIASSATARTVPATSKFWFGGVLAILGVQMLASRVLRGHENG